MFDARTGTSSIRALTAVVLACAACAGPPLPEGVVTDPPDPFTVEQVPFALGPGDVVQVVVFGHPELSTPPEFGQQIDFLGQLSLPLLDPIPLSGLDLAASRTAIEEALRRYLREPRVSISVLEYRSRSYFVYGEVELPGEFPLDRAHTALRALALAGKPTQDADLETVVVLRGGPDDLKVYAFNSETPGPDGMFQIQPNDFIFVRRTGAGTFREQILPVVQSLVPPISALATLVIAADTLNR